MKELEVLFKTVGDGLKMLAQGMNIIADKLDRYAESQKEEGEWDAEEAVSFGETPVEAPPEERSSSASERSSYPETKGASATDRVYQTLDHAEGPVDIDRLAEETGFEKKKLHNILFRLKKQGRIESVSKGVYRKVS